MAVVQVAYNSGLSVLGYKFIAATADTLPTTDPLVAAGDRAKITDGSDKIFNGSSWVTETGESLGNVGISDGGDVAEGAKADAAVTDPTASASVISLLKGLLSSSGYEVNTTVTRPANTTPYTAGDVVGGAIDLGVLGPSGQVIEIVSARLELDISAIPTGMTSFILYLYSVTPPGAVADNGVFDLPSGDRASYLGAISLGTPADLGSTCYVEANDIHKQVKLAGTHLFGYLVTVGGFTPAANSEVYKVALSTKAIF